MKPVIVLPAWASNVNFGTGPKVGKPTKVAIPGALAADGHRPGIDDPTAAEHWNYWLNGAWQYLEWVRLGSSAGAADAHIVETASDGRARLEGLDILPANNAPRALRVEGPPTAGNAIYATSGNAFADPTCYFVTTGPGAAVHVSALGALGNALIVEHDNADVPAALITGNPGAKILSNGSRPALIVEGSATCDDAMIVESKKLTGRALRVIGNTSAEALLVEGGFLWPGIYTLGGTGGGAGIVAEARHQNAHGVHGKTNAAAALTTIAGVCGEAFGNGTGGIFVAVDGHGLTAASGGNRAPFRVVPRAGDPSTASAGDVANNSTLGLYRVVVSSTWVSLMTRKNGAAGEVDAADGPFSTSNDNTNPLTVITRALTGHQAPKVAGKVRITVTGRIGRTGTCSLGAEIVDDTAVVAIKTYDGANALPLYQSGAGVYERETILSAVYQLPAAGNRTFSFTIWREGGGGGDVVRMRDVVIHVEGVFE